MKMLVQECNCTEVRTVRVINQNEKTNGNLDLYLRLQYVGSHLTFKIMMVTTYFLGFFSLLSIYIYRVYQFVFCLDVTKRPLSLSWKNWKIPRGSVRVAWVHKIVTLHLKKKKIVTILLKQC